MTLGYQVLHISFFALDQQAEGCFKMKIDKKYNTVTGFRVILRFILDHKIHNIYSYNLCSRLR